MTSLDTAIAPQVFSCSQAHAAEAAAVLSRVLGGSWQLEPGPATQLNPADLPAGLDGAGLSLVLGYGPSAAAIMLPEAGGLLPDWCGAPSATERAELLGLARELGRLFLPEDLTADRVEAVRVPNLALTLGRAAPGAGAMWLPLTLRTERGQAVLRLIWPLTCPDAILSAVANAPAGDAARSAPQPVSVPDDRTAEPNGPPPAAAADPLAQLPDYTHSLLKIEIPLYVRLASKRQSVGQVLDLCPGSIIAFDKTCDEMLQLCAGGCTIAVGEAVKVGDKFGLRISSMRQPDERFHNVHVARTQLPRGPTPEAAGSAAPLPAAERGP
ncbi:MAG: hypothetical protein A2W31_08970 [Planctomycetes bacterium RBG_16_64_10]|nr:MAG: hypothetical protein A2W31_08970 [Planctomycetes bacterium RBG_16_64_10]